MNSWGLPAVGSPGSNLKTQLRRQQRRHSQQCYRLMQAKLLALVTPVPATAIRASDLETFRSNLFNPAAELVKVKESIDGWQLKQSPTPQLTSPASVCNWCGIWMPMPMPRQIVLERPVTKLRNTEVNDGIIMAVPVTTATPLDPETVEALPVKINSADSNRNAVPYSMDDIDTDNEVFEVGAPFSCNNVLATGSTSSSDNLFECAELLTPLLSEVVLKLICTHDGNSITVADEKRLRYERAAALRARWLERPYYERQYNGLPWLPRLVPDTDQYKTDPKTGECKTQ